MRLLLAICVASGLFVSSAADAGADAVRLREVSVAREIRLTETAVRRTLRKEVERVNGRLTAARSGADVSITVTRRPSEGGFELTVSAACRDSRKGSLMGVLVGRARTVITPTMGSSEEVLLEAAAKGALSQVSTMLR